MKAKGRDDVRRDKHVVGIFTNFHYSLCPKGYGGLMRYNKTKDGSKMRTKLLAILFLCLVFSTVGCDNKSNQTEATSKHLEVSVNAGKNQYLPNVREIEGTSEHLGVSMYAEKNQYPTNVSEINVVWKNDTDKKLTFGDFFSIDKLVGQDWKVIGKKEVAFNDVGNIVSPHSEVKHSYNIRVYSDKLEQGTYRIVTDFLDVHSPSNYDTYNLTTIFTVK